MPEPVVAVRDLVVEFRRPRRVRAVDGLSLDVPAGTVTAVLGPNGAGKTTTVETCEGYRRPDAGTVRVLGLDPVTDHRRLAPRVGVMAQAGGSWSGVRAAEMLSYVARLHAHPLDPGYLVDRLGLGGCGGTPYRRLSGGQQRRLALALAVVGRPEVAFLDEPTAGLDPQARRTAWDLVSELRRDGVSVVLTTHYIEEAERLADRVYVIDAGRVLAAGSPGELTARATAGRVRFTAPPGLDTGSLRRALPPGSEVGESPPGRYHVEGPAGPDLLAAVTAWCAARGVMPERFEAGRHSLEEVFLELTGRELRS